jgi:glucan-binding YG repeat protein
LIKKKTDYNLIEASDLLNEIMDTNLNSTNNFMIKKDDHNIDVLSHSSLSSIDSGEDESDDDEDDDDDEDEDIKKVPTSIYEYEEEKEEEQQQIGTEQIKQLRINKSKEELSNLNDDHYHHHNLISQTLTLDSILSDIKLENNYQIMQQKLKEQQIKVSFFIKYLL